MQERLGILQRRRLRDRPRVDYGRLIQARMQVGSSWKSRVWSVSRLLMRTRQRTLGSAATAIEPEADEVAYRRATSTKTRRRRTGAQVRGRRRRSRLGPGSRPVPRRDRRDADPARFRRDRPSDTRACQPFDVPARVRPRSVRSHMAASAVPRRVSRPRAPSNGASFVRDNVHPSAANRAGSLQPTALGGASGRSEVNERDAAITPTGDGAARSRVDGSARGPGLTRRRRAMQEIASPSASAWSSGGRPRGGFVRSTSTPRSPTGLTTAGVFGGLVSSRSRTRTSANRPDESSRWSLVSCSRERIADSLTIGVGWREFGRPGACRAAGDAGPAVTSSSLMGDAADDLPLPTRK